MELLPEFERQKIKKRASKIRPVFKNPIVNIFFFETFGSLILAYGICVTEYIHPISRQIVNPYWTFLISCFNFFAISISGLFTGGHVNPSATIGLRVAGLVDRSKVLAYFASQLIGAILGTLIYYAFFQQNTQIYSQTPSIGDVVLDSLGEIVGTFIFVFAVLHIVIGDYMKGEPFRYFFISLMLLVARTFTWRKGCLNPAVALAFQIFAAGSNQDFSLFYSVFGLITGEIIGAVLAAIFYTRFYNPLLKEVENQQ